MTDTPEPGEVFRYPYLWHRQAEAGETAGRKSRPVCVAIAAQGRDGATLLFILAITAREPVAGRLAVEVPQIERRRAGLDPEFRSWVILDEVNVDVLERSYTFEDRTPLGRFGPAFTRRLQSKLRDARRKARVRAVGRS